MLELAGQFVKDASEAPATAAYVVHATMGISIGQWLNLIPDDIGKLGTLIALMSSVLITYTVVRKWHIDYKQSKINARKIELEIKLMEKELDDE